MPAWNIDVTVDDIRAVRDDWERAQARGDDPAKVARLWRDVEDMCRAHVWQLLEGRFPPTPGRDM